jgi:hypothetical protein
MPETMTWPPSAAEDLRLRQDLVDVLRLWQPTVILKCDGRKIGRVKLASPFLGMADIAGAPPPGTGRPLSRVIGARRTLMLMIREIAAVNDTRLPPYYYDDRPPPPIANGSTEDDCDDNAFEPPPIGSVSPAFDPDLLPDPAALLAGAIGRPDFAAPADLGDVQSVFDRRAIVDGLPPPTGTPDRQAVGADSHEASRPPTPFGIAAAQNVLDPMGNVTGFVLPDDDPDLANFPNLSYGEQMREVGTVVGDFALGGAKGVVNGVPNLVFDAGKGWIYAGALLWDLGRYAAFGQPYDRFSTLWGAYDRLSRLNADILGYGDDIQRAGGFVGAFASPAAYGKALSLLGTASSAGAGALRRIGVPDRKIGLPAYDPNLLYSNPIPLALTPLDPLVEVESGIKAIGNSLEQSTTTSVAEQAARDAMPAPKAPGAAPNAEAAAPAEGAETQAANSPFKIHAAKLGAPKGYTPTAEQAEILRRLLQQRTDLLSQVSKLNAEADAAVAAGDVDAANGLAGEANKLKYGSANRVTEEIGETGAKNAMRAAFPDAGEPIYVGSGKNTLDLAYNVKNRLVLVEAKGGGSQLGYRQLENGGAAQQGTREYLQGTASAMKASGNPATRKMGQELEMALAEGRVDYYVARTAVKMDAGGKNIVMPTTLQQFNLTPR